MDAARLRGFGYRRWLAMVLAVSLVAGCGQSAPTSTPPSGVASPPASTAEAPATAESATGTPLPGGPAIATPAEAPTVIEVAHETVLAESVTPDGANFEVEGATLLVPPGAVATDTRVEIVRVDAPFGQNPYARDEEGSVAAVAAGPVLDFGPAGVTFASPVTVTLPYDPAAATDELAQPAIAYHTGTRWVILGGTVDPVAHTVTISQDAFEGELFTTILVGTALGTLAHAGVKWYYGKEAVKTDPISDKKAGSWITPKDPAVQAAAASATVNGVPLSDPKALAAYVAKNPGRTGAITVQAADGSVRTQRYSDKDGTNWQQPADYLGKNGMKGDCTDVTAAMVSIFRNLGYPAKAVFGYVVDKGSPHVWGEVAIGGKPYLIDEEGHLQPLDEGMQQLKLIRPDPTDPRAFMWDENGQVPYQAAWWDATAINGKWAGTLTFTELTVDEDAAKEAADQGCTVALLEELKGKPLPLTMDIAVDESGKGKVTMKIDLSALKDGKGNSLKSEPQTIKVTYRDGTLTFDLSESPGVTSSMTGRLMGDIGGGPTIEGTMRFKGKGFSATAAWSVAR